MATPYAIHRLDEVASTQDEARARFADEGPVVVLAGRQTRGRGRTGAGWVHAPRATAASVAVRPEWPPGTWGVLPLIAGMAARTAVANRLGVEPTLKWPNDLMLGDAKAGGILVEAAEGVVVAGCGINVWWPDPPAGMTGVSAIDIGADQTFALAEAWAVAFLDGVAAGPAAWDPDAYAAVCSTLGGEIEWEPRGTGRAIAIAADGGLVVETPDGRVTLRSGAVRTLRRR